MGPLDVTKDRTADGPARRHVFGERWFCARRVPRAAENSPARSDAKRAECWVGRAVNRESVLTDDTTTRGREPEQTAISRAMVCPLKAWFSHYFIFVVTSGPLGPRGICCFAGTDCPANTKPGGRDMTAQD